MSERLQKNIKPPKRTLTELLNDKSVLTGREVVQRIKDKEKLDDLQNENVKGLKSNQKLLDQVLSLQNEIVMRDNQAHKDIRNLNKRLTAERRKAETLQEMYDVLNKTTIVSDKKYRELEKVYKKSEGLSTSMIDDKGNILSRELTMETKYTSCGHCGHLVAFRLVDGIN